MTPPVGKFLERYTKKGAHICNEYLIQSVHTDLNIVKAKRTIKLLRLLKIVIKKKFIEFECMSSKALLK